MAMKRDISIFFIRRGDERTYLWLAQKYDILLREPRKKEQKGRKNGRKGRNSSVFGSEPTNNEEERRCIAANVPYSAADRSLADVLEREKTGKVER